MSIQLLYQLKVVNRSGRIALDTGKLPAHSYVKQFLQLIEGFYNVINIVATDTSNAQTTLWQGAASINYNLGRVDAAVGDANYGILVGTNAGVTAENNANYALGTKILHSATGEAGKLNYRAVTMVSTRVVGADVDFDISRPFVNESGNTITVKEIGLVCKNLNGNQYHLLLRDVTADTDVPDDNTLTAVYTLRTTA